MQQKWHMKNLHWRRITIMSTWNEAKQAQLDSLQQEYHQWRNSNLPAIRTELSQLLNTPVAIGDAIHIITNAGEIISYLNQFKSK